MTVLALSGGEITIALVALAFIVFSLVVSMVVPRYRPDFPGPGGVGALTLASIVFFLGTMTAVFVLGEGHSAEHAETPAAPGAGTESPEEDEEGDEEASPEIAETVPATTAGAPPEETITVTATDEGFELSESELEPGGYTFVLENEGESPHNLVVEGPGLANTESDVVEPGESTELDVVLREGEYRLSSSVEGDEAAGLVEEIEIQ